MDSDSGMLVTVARFRNQLEASLARGLLESAGIRCFLQGENALNNIGCSFDAARLQVAAGDEAAANELLSQSESPGNNG
jgi:hypothetical protein